MNNIKITKQKISPKDYYKDNLKGSLGKPSNNNWHVWNGLCPFHADKNSGSFFINIRTGAFKCFSCGSSGGDIISFHMLNRSINFKTAIKELKGDLS